MMRLKFGIGLLPENLSDVVEQAKLADDLGYDLIRIADSQAGFHDLYVTLTLVALNTKNAMIGPGVTNPITRHPTVSAGSIAGIDELSGGRAIFGIGSGMSAVGNIGLKPASIQLMRDYVTAVRELYRSGETTFQGKTIRMTWYKRQIPIWMAATGPKALRLAGELADVVVMGSGFQPENINTDLPYVEEGAKAAGRKLKDIEVWVFGPANIANSRQEAFEPMKAGAIASGYYAVKRDLDLKRVPEEMIPVFRRLIDEYHMEEHQKGPGSANERLLQELGLDDYLGRRFTLAGTYEQLIEQAKTIANTGVQGLMLTIVTPDKMKTIRDIGEKVMPFFR